MEINHENNRFTGAKWISYCDGYVSFPLVVDTVPYIRKEFSVSKPVKSASLAISGLGLYKTYINGKAPTDAVLMPLFTNYNKRVLYDVFDITDLLTVGNNCIGTVLGNGFYCQGCKDVWQFEYASWKNVPKLLFKIVIEYRDETVQTVVSDTDARFSSGPITFNEIRNGEYYDARLEQPGWNTPGFDDSGWKNVFITKPAGMLHRNTAPLIKPFAVYESKIIKSQNNKTVYDFGQNMAGYIILSGKAKEGTQLTIRYSELLDSENNIDTRQISWLVCSGEFQTDKYTFGNHAVDKWSPVFTYHGFRYVEIEGTDDADITVSAAAISSDFEKISCFVSSDKYFQSLYHITDMSDRSNFVGIPTDCPQREKNGWMSEGLLSSERILCHYDSSSAYEKWLDDMVDAMLPTGELPGVVPTPGYGYLWGNGPTYDYALIKIAWNIYRETGNAGILKKYYEPIRKSVKYQEYFLREDYTVDYGLFDWLSVDIYNPCSKVITSTSYYYSSCDLLGRIAGILGDEETEKYYMALAGKIKISFNKNYVNATTGKVGFDECGYQTAQCVPLYYRLIDDNNKVNALDFLKKAVEDKDGHISTGTYGTHCILEVLSENGMLKEAYEMVMKKDYPGWGFMLEKGATTLWEMWNAGRDEEWYGSLNHNVYGSVADWMERYIVGIRQVDESVGYSKVIINPAVMFNTGDMGITRKTVKGTLSVRISYNAGDRNNTVKITVPSGCTALFGVPDGYKSDYEGILECGEYTFTVRKA